MPSWIQQDKLDPGKARAHDCILRGPEQARRACCAVCFTLLSQLQKARHHGTNISISWAPLNRQSELRAAQQPQHLSHNAPQPAIRALTRIFLYSWTTAATGGPGLSFPHPARGTSSERWGTESHKETFMSYTPYTSSPLPKGTETRLKRSAEPLVTLCRTFSQPRADPATCEIGRAHV